MEFWAAGPLCSGIWARDPRNASKVTFADGQSRWCYPDSRMPVTWNYHDITECELKFAIRAWDIVSTFDVPMSAVAYQFALADRRVSAIVAGAGSPERWPKTARELEMPLPRKLWAELRRSEIIHKDAVTPD